MIHGYCFADDQIHCSTSSKSSSLKKKFNNQLAATIFMRIPPNNNKPNDNEEETKRTNIVLDGYEKKGPEKKCMKTGKRTQIRVHSYCDITSWRWKNFEHLRECRKFIFLYYENN